VRYPDEANFVAAEAALHGIGLRARLPVDARQVFRFRREYIDDRHLIAWSFVDPADPTRLVDVILTYEHRTLPTKMVTVEGVPVPVLSRAALLRMKERSGRPQDLEDVAALRSLGEGAAMSRQPPRTVSPKIDSSPPSSGTAVERPVQRITDAYLEHCARMTPNQIARFVDDYRRMVLSTTSDRPKKLISLRVDEPLLHVFRRKAEAEGVPYQTMIRRLMEAWARS